MSTYNKFNLSCAELPAPQKDPLTGEWGILQPTEIHTRLSQEEFIGNIYRNYPVPSMSFAFFKLIQQISADLDPQKTKEGNDNPTHAWIGTTSVGKTSTAEAAFYSIFGVQPAVFDCGNRSLDDLVWEPVLNPGDSLTSQLEERFNSGAMNPGNRDYLRNQVPEGIGQNAAGEEVFDFSLVAKIKDSQRLEEAVSQVERAIRLEGIVAQSGINMTYKPGLLIQVWENAKNGVKDAPTALIIDEIDKRLEGTGTSLQQLWLVFNGTRESHTVTAKGKTYTFSRKDMAPEFRLLITGNDTRDLGNAQGLSQSQLTRLDVTEFKEVDKEDFIHRICQQLTGIPFILDQALTKCPDHIRTQLLLDLRNLGNSTPATSYETFMIENRPDTYQAAKQLATFYTTLAAKFDPLNPKVDDPDLENSVNTREPISVRMCHKHIKNTLNYTMPEVLPAKEVKASANPLKALLRNDPLPPAPERSIGDKLARVILTDLITKCPNDNLKREVFTTAQASGLHGELPEENGENKDFKAIPDLLNNLSENLKIELSTRVLQHNLYHAFVADHPELRNAEMESLLPCKDLQATINEQFEKGKNLTTNEITYIPNINKGFLDGNKKEKALECIPVLYTFEDSHTSAIRNMDPEKRKTMMMETTTLRAILETPKVGEQALESFWSQSWKNFLSSAAEMKSYDISNGDSQQLRIAKVLTLGKDGEPELSLIFQSQEHKTVWMVSEQAEEKTVEHARGHVHYFPVEKAEEAETAILDKIPNVPVGAVADVLWALSQHPDKTGNPDKLADYIKMAASPNKSGRRSLFSTRVPMKIDPKKLEQPIQQ